jgi:signal transduction histidine kinase/CheY-like chemotaxis protein
MFWLRNGLAVLQQAELNTAPNPLERLFLLLFGVIIANLCAFLLMAEPFAFQYAFWVALTSVGLTGLAHKLLRWSLKLTTHMLLIQSYVLVMYCVWVSGGLFSSAIIWLIILPVPAMFMLGLRDSLLWIAVVLLSVTSFVPLTEYGWLPVSYVYSQKHLLWSFGNYAFTAISLVSGLLVYKRIYTNQLNEINQRNDELMANRSALLQAESYKDQFLASVGHELRTPMNAILGFNDVIRAELEADEKSVQTLNLIRESTEHLLTLVNQILDFSQIQAGRLQLQMTPTRFASSFSQCVEKYSRPPRDPVQFRASLSPELPEWLMTDALRLKEVLCHLIGNAFKFTPNGEVSLQISKDQEAVLFEVTDTGVGIAPELQAFIFNRFEHADQQTHTEFGGAGLGLSICKGLIDLFGGQIGMRSEPGQGSCFWFRIPLQACDAPVSHSNTVHHGDVLKEHALTLLLVDDNPMNLKVASLICQQLWPRAQVNCVDSGASCLAFLQSHPVDAVLMDLVMPQMNGLEATRAIRSSGDLHMSQVVVIGLTASSHPHDHAECLAAGMNDVVVKPLSRDMLKASVERLVQAQRVQHA